MRWAKIALAELTTKIGSGATPKGGDSSYKETGIPLIRSMNVHDGEFRSKGLAFIDDAQASLLSNVTLQADDLLLNITGASVARVCTLPKAYNGGRVNQHVAIVRPKAEMLLPKYLEHYLINPRTKAELLGIAGAGATREAITKANIETLEIPLPPLEEQKRIAAILDQADALRRLRARALDRLNALGQAIFHEMFGHGIAASAWEARPLSEVVRKGTIVTYGIVQAGEEYPNGVPYIRTGDLNAGVIQEVGLRHTGPEIAAKFARSRVETGDIVMSIRATVGTTAIVRPSLDGANLTQGTARISPGPDLTSDYLNCYLQTAAVQGWIKRQVKGATFLEITLGRLRELVVHVPPLDLQQQFSTRIAALAINRSLQQDAAKLVEQTFTSLQHRAFRGEL